MDIQHAIDKHKNRLAYRISALKDTLAEIELIDPLETAAPGTYSDALTQLRTKRDRQQAAIAATEALIKGFISATKKR